MAPEVSPPDVAPLARTKETLVGGLTARRRDWAYSAALERVFLFRAQLGIAPAFCFRRTKFKKEAAKPLCDSLQLLPIINTTFGHNVLELRIRHFPSPQRN
jgi:hypothetical protein